MAKKSDDGEPPIAELKKRQAKVTSLLAEIRALFPNARRIAKNDRRRSQGKLGAQEAVALRSVVATMEAEPAIFGVLADEDEGHDPNKLETDLLRDRFDRQQIYAELAAQVEDVAPLFSDAALTMGALVKPVTQAGYEIAKPLSKRHAVIREKIAPLVDYYVIWGLDTLFWGIAPRLYGARYKCLQTAVRVAWSMPCGKTSESSRCHPRRKRFRDEPPGCPFAPRTS